MKANELRLNNWVKAFKTYWQIDNSDFSNLDQIETYEFIPLTEDILLKCGFVKVLGCSKIWALINNEIELSLTLDYKLFSVTIDSQYRFPFKRKLEYLHQLQNLYFELTGRELEINL